MAKKEDRIDKAINKAKVVWAVLKAPLATQRKIAKEAWVSLWTANTHLNNIEQNWTKSIAIEEIIKRDISIVELAQGILEKRLRDKWDDISTRDIISSADVSAKRYSLFRWGITDIDGGLKEIKNYSILSDEELDKIIQSRK